MKNKLKHHINVSEGRLLLNIHTCESFQSVKPGITDLRRKRKTFTRSRLEDFIPDEFNIDSETMEEHLSELLLFMMRKDIASNINHG